jgi:putative ABC transport system ATP-binding protein
VSAVAIVGASGSGKSTLLSLLAGLDTPTPAACTSTASRSRRSTKTAARACAARKVGFVFQSFQLLPR